MRFQLFIGGICAAGFSLAAIRRDVGPGRARGSNQIGPRGVYAAG